jgi:hypothetical protein
MVRRRTVRRKKGAGLLGCLGSLCSKRAAPRPEGSATQPDMDAALREWRRQAAEGERKEKEAAAEAAVAARAEDARAERAHQERLARKEKEAIEAEQRARAAKAEAAAAAAERERQESEARRAREAKEAEAEIHERKAAKYKGEEEAARAKLLKAEEKLSNSAPEDREGFERVVREINRAMLSAKGEKKKHANAAEGIREKLKGGRRRSRRRRKSRGRR